jgi:phosphoserine phosphatase RsbU/P
LCRTASTGLEEGPVGLGSDTHLSSFSRLASVPTIAEHQQLPDFGPARHLLRLLESGIYYDFFRYPGKAISAQAVGDVSGKEAAAAIYAGLVTGILRSLAPLELGPAEMLSRLNKAL